MSNQSLSTAQVLQAIQAEIATSASVEAGLAGQFQRIRQLQHDFETRPVIGQYTGLKKLIYSLTHSTFSQQYNMNYALIGLIETLYSELEQYKALHNQKLTDLQYQLNSLNLEETLDRKQVISPSSTNNKTNDNDAGGVKTLTGLSKIYTAPILMLMPERVALYSLIYGLKPRHYLEVGTFQGGSAVIVCAAMDDTGFGQLVCVDPNPRLTDETWQQICHRARVVTGPSPDVLPQAAAMISEKFDFAMIDGDHSYEGVVKDIEGALPLLANRAYLLFHDCHYFEIEEAINFALKKYPTQLSDFGLISVQKNPQDQFVNGKQVIWGGLRLLKFQRNA